MSHLVSDRLKLDSWTRPDDDKRVQEMTFDTGRREVGVVGFQENHANNVIANVTFPLQLYTQRGKKVTEFVRILSG